MKIAGLLSLLPLLLYIQCIKLDFFLFAGTGAESVESTYHGLPLFVGNSSPSWITTAEVEKEIFLDHSGKQIKKDDVSQYDDYVHGSFIPAPKNVTPAVCPLAGRSITFIFAHGNSGDMYRYWYKAVQLWSMGANVFIFTNRGYGLSKGKTTRGNIKEDANAAATYVKTRADVDTGKIVVYGVSMGALTATYLVGASPHKNSFAGVIIEAGLDKPENIVAQSSGINFPDGYFLDDEMFNGLEFIKGATIPILHMHSIIDKRVVIEQAYRYYEILKDRPNYTCYIGKSTQPDEAWIAQANHGNTPHIAFKGEKQISDYWDDATNPKHCCINPFEFNEPQFQGFLSAVGETNGSEMTRTYQNYHKLISDWVLKTVP